MKIYEGKIGKESRYGHLKAKERGKKDKKIHFPLSLSSQWYALFCVGDWRR
jgi:hypothetical protein